MKARGLCVLAAPAAAGVAAADTPPGQGRIEDGAAAQPLTAGAAAGRASLLNRKLGKRLARHADADLPEHAVHGETAPAIDGVADRDASAELRAIVVDCKAVFGDHTLTPRFHRVDGHSRVAEVVQGRTILSAQQVEDGVAYSQTLREAPRRAGEGRMLWE